MVAAPAAPGKPKPASAGRRGRQRDADAPSSSPSGFVSAAEYAALRAAEEQASEPGKPGPAKDAARQARGSREAPGAREETARRASKRPMPRREAAKKRGASRERPSEAAAGPRADPGTGGGLRNQPHGPSGGAREAKPPKAESPKAPRTVPFPAGLDPRVRSAIEATGIPSLYPPQAEALEAALTGQSVLASIPTASGKSLIAHGAMLSRLIARGGKGLYVVPLRALASEKYEELRELTGHITAPKLKVGIATGDLDEADRYLGRFDIVVTTSEKADSLMRHQAGWIRELSCVVADEIHLLGDPGRGPTLEVLLARLKALNEDTQLIGLSATVGNAEDIARWLDAHHVTSDWRPVVLKEGVFQDDLILFADGSTRQVGETGDAVTRLAVDTLREGGQCLVFVNTRRSTEAVALRVAPKLKDLLNEKDRAALTDAAKRLRDEGGETSRLGAKLADALERGAAFHNAGLSSAQRRVVETLFRAGHVKTIVATPTLAAGVNLPARRVVLRDTTRYDANLGMSARLPVMEVKQMTGRAGRPRYDPYGEAVLIARSTEDRDSLFETYLQGEPEAIHSRLGVPAAMRIHLLSGIATGFTDTEERVMEFIDGTFLSRDPTYGGRWRLQEQVHDVLDFLEQGDFIERDGAYLRATRFGKRTSDLYIDPETSLRLRDGLRVAEDREHVSDLALLALIAGTPDVHPLWLRKNDEWVEAQAEEQQGQWLSRPDGAAGNDEYFLAELKTALLVQDWANETPLERMEDKYGLGPGDIHNRVQITEWLLHATEEFARMEGNPHATVINKLKRRVHHGVRDDLLKIIALEGIGRYRARVLAKAGYGTLAKLKKAPAERLLTLPGFGPLLVRNLLRQLDRDADLDALKRAKARTGKAAAAKAEKESPTHRAQKEQGKSGTASRAPEGATTAAPTTPAARPIEAPRAPTQSALHRFDESTPNGPAASPEAEGSPPAAHPRKRVVKRTAKKTQARRSQDDTKEDDDA